MIGIFDSGSGGLTVLKALKEIAPEMEVLYLGDNKNAPYGERSREQLGALTIAGFRRLREEGAEGILSACNSVSAFTVLSVFETIGINPLNVIEMAGPTIEYLKKEGYRSAGILATPVTINSGLYQNALTGSGINVSEAIPIPHLAGAIEFGEPEIRLKNIVGQALNDTRIYSEVIILGCTHYPLIRHLFENYFKNKGVATKLLDPASLAAQRAINRFKPDDSSNGKIKFLITKNSPIFRKRVEEMFPHFPHQIEITELM